MTPIFPTMMVRILPPRIRAQGQSFTSVAIALGSIFAIPIAGFGENGNYRPAFAVLSVVLGMAAPVIWSAHRFLDADIAKTDAALLATVADPPGGG